VTRARASMQVLTFETVRGSIICSSYYCNFALPQSIRSADIGMSTDDRVYGAIQKCSRSLPRGGGDWCGRVCDQRCGLRLGYFVRRVQGLMASSTASITSNREEQMGEAKDWVIEMQSRRIGPTSDKGCLR